MRRSYRALLLLAALVYVAGCGESPTGEDVDGAKPLPPGFRLRTEQYPPQRLRFDDGRPELGRGFNTTSWQLCTVFRNPYPVPVQIDTLWMFFHGASGINAPFQFALFHVDSILGPSTALEASPVFGVRAPLDRFGIYTAFQSIIPPHGLFAGGMRAISNNDLVSIGHDFSSPFFAKTFYVTIPSGSQFWLPFEQAGSPGEVPMIRVSLSPVYAARGVGVPSPPGSGGDGYSVYDPSSRPAAGRTRSRSATHSMW